MFHLNDFKIKTKLLILILIPLICCISLSVLVLLDYHERISNLRSLKVCATLSVSLSEIVDSLQIERNASLGYADSHIDIFAKRLKSARKETDNKLDIFHKHIQQYQSDNDNLEVIYKNIKNLDQLLIVRGNVDNKSISDYKVYLYYTGTINNLIQAMNYEIKNSKPNLVARSLSSYAHFIKAKENASLESIYVTLILLNEDIDLNNIFNVVATRSSQKQLFQNFEEYSQIKFVNALERILNSQVAKELNILRDEAFSKFYLNQNANIDPAYWDKISNEKSIMLKELQDKIATQILDDLQSQIHDSLVKFYIVLFIISICIILTLYINYQITQNLSNKVLKILNFLLTLENINEIKNISVNHSSKDEIDLIANAIYNFALSAQAVVYKSQNAKTFTNEPNSHKRDLHQSLLNIKKDFNHDLNKYNCNNQEKLKVSILETIARINNHSNFIIDKLTVMINDLTSFNSDLINNNTLEDQEGLKNKKLLTSSNDLIDVIRENLNIIYLNFNQIKNGANNNREINQIIKVLYIIMQNTHLLYSNIKLVDEQLKYIGGISENINNFLVNDANQLHLIEEEIYKLDKYTIKIKKLLNKYTQFSTHNL